MTEIKFNGNANDLSMLLVSAVRYALGRRTYIVSWTVEVVINNLDNLTKKDKQVMIRDIKEQANYGYGDECDKQEWLELLKRLEEFENER